MKDLGKTQYVLGIKVTKNHKNRKLVLSQATYIDKPLVKYVMQDSKKGFPPFKHGIPFSQDQCPKILKDKKRMQTILYA